MNICRIFYFSIAFISLPAFAATMKTCIDHYPPLQILSDEPSGESVEVLKLLAKLLGHDIEFIPGPNFARCLRMLELGQVDALAALVDNPTRREFAYFVSYREDDSFIFVNRFDGKDIEKLEDLTGLVVGVTKSTSYFKELELEQKITKVLIKDITSGLKMLVKNRIDVIITSAPIFHSAQNELVNISDKIKVNSFKYHTVRKQSFGLSKKSKLEFTSDDILKINQASQQNVFSKVIEQFISANPELYFKTEQ